MGTDYYETLGLDKDADENAVKKAYRREALQWHPDKHHGEAKIQAEVRFKLIAEAYEVLKDPEKRRIYDLYGCVCGFYSFFNIYGIDLGIDNLLLASSNASDVCANREEGLKSGIPFPESTSSGSRTGFMFHDPQEIFREFFGGRDPFQAFFDDPFFSDPFSNDPFFNSSPFSRGSRQTQQTRQSGFRQTNDPFARMGFGDPFFGMGGFGGMGMGMGLLGMNSFGGMNSGMGGSGTSTSFSFSSSSGGSGYASTQTTTRYINGQKTTITKTTDASGNVTETTIVENADGTRRVENNVNGVRSIENSRSASTGVTTRHGGDDMRRIRESESRRSHSHTVPSSASSSTRRNIPISSPDHSASSRRQPHRERARPEPEPFRSSTHFSSRQHSTGYDDEIDYTDGGQSSNDYVDDSGRFNARSRGRPY